MDRQQAIKKETSYQFKLIKKNATICQLDIHRYCIYTFVL